MLIDANGVRFIVPTFALMVRSHFVPSNMVLVQKERTVSIQFP